MNLILIGKFIAEERKRKGFTQKQLSEKLGISDKTISKWECGNGFPDISLLLPLCKELDITVNELLSGQRVSEEDYQRKAEENMVNMIREKEENRKKFILTVTIGIISTVTFITLLLVVCMYTEVIELPVKVLLIAIACAIFAVGVAVAAEGDRKIGFFKCKKCGELFIPSFAAYTFGMHIVTTRYLKCPHCGSRSWCKKVMSKKD